MSVTTTPLSRRRAMTTGLAGAAALMTLAPTRAWARDAELAARLDEAIDRALADRKIVGTLVTVVRSGDVAYRRAAGYADREAGRAMRADALFRLASLSKTMVSAAALALVEQGRLAVTDPVAQWLPDFKPRTRDGQVPVLTVHHLLTHTAGLSYGFYEPEDGPYHQAGVSDGLDLSGLSLDEEVRRIAAAGLAEAPGTRWRYSIASDVLGAVIARAAGEPLPEAVRRLVTAPLGMTDTGFSVTDRTRLAVPYADAQPTPSRCPSAWASRSWCHSGGSAWCASRRRGCSTPPSFHRAAPAWSAAPTTWSASSRPCAPAGDRSCSQRPPAG